MDEALADLVEMVDLDTGELRIDLLDRWDPRIRREFERSLWMKEELPGLLFKAVKRRLRPLLRGDFGLTVGGDWGGAWVSRELATEGTSSVVRHEELAGLCPALGWTAMPRMNSSALRESGSEPSPEQEAVHINVDAVDIKADVAAFRKLREGSMSVIDVCRRRLDERERMPAAERADGFRRFFHDLVLHHELGHVQTDERVAGIAAANEDAYTICQEDAAELLANAHAARHLLGKGEEHWLEKWLVFHCSPAFEEWIRKPFPDLPQYDPEIGIHRVPSVHQVYTLRSAFEPDPVNWLQEQVEFMEAELAAFPDKLGYGSCYLSRAEGIRGELVAKFGRLPEP